MATNASLQEAEEQRYGACLAADIPTLDNLLHEDLVYGHSTGAADSKASYLEALKSGGLRYHEIARSDVSFIDRQTFTLVFCTVAMSVTVAGELRQLKNRTIAVWESQAPNGWRLLASHSTPLAIS